MNSGSLTHSVAVIRSAGEQGTGFFISPRLMVTAAHVVAKAAVHAAVSVSFLGNAMEATLVDKRADDDDTPQRLPFPDVALLQFAEDVADVQPLLLTEAVPPSGERVYCRGFPVRSEAGGEDVGAIVEGTRGVTSDTRRFRVKLSTGEFQAGMSGAPAVLANGCVAGVVTLTRGDNSDRGGFFTPTCELVRAFGERIGQLVVSNVSGRLPSALQCMLDKYRERASMNFARVRIPATGSQQSERSLRTLYVTRTLRQTARGREAGIGNDSAASASSAHDASRSFSDVLSGPAPVRAVVTGDAGDGKSTLLYHEMLAWADGASTQVPFLIELRNFAGGRARSQEILEHLERGNYELPQAEVASLLEEGKASLLFDALDEVLETTERPDVVDKIVQAARRYPRAPIVVTTRSTSYMGSDAASSLEAAGFSRFVLENFDAGQTSDFLNKWFAPQSLGNESGRREAAAQLLQAIEESASVRQLAAKPLLLTMMARVGQASNRAQLYRQFIEVRIAEWDVMRCLRSRSATRLSLKLAALEDVALAMCEDAQGLARNVISHEHLRAVIAAAARRETSNPLDDADELFDAFTDRDSMLGPLGEGRYAFVFQTFLEYFFARALCAKLGEASDELVSWFREHWQDPQLEEVFRLICGIREERAAPLIRELLAQCRLRNGWRAVFLAADGLEESNLGDKVPALDEESRRELRALLCFDLPYPYEWNEPDRNLVPAVRRGAAVRLARRPDESTREDLRRAVLSGDPPAALAILPIVVATWPDDATMDWLRELQAHEGIRDLRLAATHELARYRPDESTRSWLLEALQKDDDPLVRFAATSELASEWPDDAVKSALFACAEGDCDEYVRIEALAALAWRWPGPEVSETLLRVAQTGKPWRIRNGVLGLLARSSADGKLRQLVADCAANDERWMIRQTALTAVGNWPDEEMRALVVARVAQDPDPFVRGLAAVVAAKFWPSESTRHFLLTRMKDDPDGNARLAIFRELVRHWPDALSDGMLDDVVHADAGAGVRGVALEELIRRCPGESTLQLIRDLAERDGSPDVRIACAAMVARTAPRDELSAWLKERAERETEPRVKAAVVAEISRNCTEESVRDWLLGIASADGWEAVGATAVSALVRRWPDERTRAWLIELIRAGDLVRSELPAWGFITDPSDNFRIQSRQTAIGELARVWRDRETRDFLMQIEQEDRWLLADAAIRAVAWNWPGEETSSWLEELLCGEHTYFVQAAAAEAIAFRRHDKSIRRLLEDVASRHPQENVRSAALKGLAYQWREPSTRLLLMKCAEDDPSAHLRSVAISALTNAWDDEDIRAFLERRLAAEQNVANSTPLTNIALRQSIIQTLLRW